MEKVIRFVLLGIFGVVVTATAEAQTWPIGTTDYLSSAFGPRNIGSQEYPDLGYIYDFHRGVDIARTGNVQAILSGTVKEIYGSGMVVETDQSPWWGYFRYYHFDAKDALSVGSTITEGEFIGTVASGDDHLDVKFYNWDYNDPDDAWNPMAILPYTNNDTNFKISTPQIGSDAEGTYVEYYVRCDDDELDVETIKLFLIGEDEYGNEYDESQLILWGENEVDYNIRKNCGDDQGYTNGIRIIPRIFHYWDSYKTVYFRFYFDPFYYGEMVSIVGKAVAYDLYRTEISSNWVEIPTGVEPGPPGSPPPPTGLTANSNTSTMTVDLQWDESPYQWEVQFYAVYRRPEDSDPSSTKCIGITAQTSFEDDYETTPGMSYYYAIAAVNHIGEGLNSEEVFVTFPSYGHVTTDRLWKDSISLTGDVIVNSDVTLSIFRGSTLTFSANSDDYDGGMGEYSSNLCELVVKGKLVAQGDPENDPIYFKSSSNSNNPGEWYGIVFENTAEDESELYGCVIKNAKYGIYDYGTNLNIEKNSIIYNQFTGIVCNSYASPTIYDNYIQFNGSWGIWCYNHSSPYIRHNRISDNDSWGLVCSVCSSPQLSGENSSNPYGANEVEDNGAGEVICYSSCYPCLGFGISEQSKGMNTIKAETGLYEVKSYSSNPIYAHFNYWGEDGANTSDNVETNCPRDDPYSGVGPTWASGGGSPLQRFPSVEVADLGSQPFRLNRSLGNGDIEEYVRRGLASEGDKDYEGAVVAYRYVVDYYPESEYAPFCLSRLITCRASERKDGLEAGWLRGKATTLSNSPVGKLASLVLPLSMAAGGNFQGAIEECERVARFYQKTDIQIVKEALFEMGHIYLFYMGDKQMAKQVFQELAKRFPGDELLEAAQELMGTFHSEGLRKKELDPKESTAPANCSLFQNYPNPGNPSTTITFTLPRTTHVTLEIYNLLGQRVRTLVDGAIDAGSHTVVWDGRDEFGKIVPTGIYLYRLQSADFVRVRKLVLVR